MEVVKVEDIKTLTGNDRLKDEMLALIKSGKLVVYHAKRLTDK